MSNSDRNVGCNASHHVSLQEFFAIDDRRLRVNIAVQAEELPNESIEVWINLNQSIVPPELKNALQEENMSITQPNRGTNIIIISGIPPWNNFDAQQVLQIVRGHVANALLA